MFYGPHVPSYMRDKDRGEVYSCVMAIRNMDSKKIIGVVKVDADVEEIQKELEINGRNKL